MTRAQRLALADWLSHYSGTEIILEATMEKMLIEHGVRYSVIEGRLILMKSPQFSVSIDVRSRDRFIEELPPSARHALMPGAWRGVMILDVARALCTLAQLGDPAKHERGTLTRFRAYVNALKQQHKEESQR